MYRQITSKRTRWIFVLFCFSFLGLVIWTIPLGTSRAVETSSTDEKLQAIQAWRMTIRSLPRDSDTRKNALEKLDAEFQALIQESPEHIPARISYAQFLKRQHRYTEATAQLHTAEQLDPDNPETLNTIGNAMLRSGRVKTAADYFARAVELEPNNPEFHFNLGNVLVLFRHELHGKFGADSDAVLTNSLQHFRTARDLLPHSVRFASAYAETYYIVNPPQWENAILAWKYVASIDPTNDRVFIHLARCSIKLQRKQDAIHYLSQITDKNLQSISTTIQKQIDKLP